MRYAVSLNKTEESQGDDYQGYYHIVPDLVPYLDRHKEMTQRECETLVW